MLRYRSVLVALGFCALTSIASAALMDGVISGWTFNDGTINDKWGRSNGQLKGGAKVAAGGKIGQGLELNGTDAYMEIPHVAAYDAFANGYTVSAWAFVRQGRDHSSIVWKGTHVGWGPNFTFRLLTTSNTNLTWGGCPEGVEGWFATDNAYNASEWIHVALTADGTNITAYVNGEMPAATGGGTNPNPVKGPYLTFPERPITIGRGQGVGGDLNNITYLDGIVDEVIVFGRALSQAEVKQLGTTDFTTAVEPESKLATQWASLKAR